MLAEKKQILIVDDSPPDIQLLMKNLKDDYAIVVATTGEKALEIVSKDSKPCVILMDVMMPGMNGYETCEKIKAQDETKHIDVIFVSAHDTIAEKMAGYEAGGTDYVIKPISPTELLKKIDIAISNQLIRKELVSENKVAMETAMTALYSSGEIGVVLEFLRKSFAVDGVIGLAELLIETMVSGYQLEISVQIRTDFGEFNYGSNGPVAELEQELLRRLKNSNRIIEKNRRLIVNYDKPRFIS